MRALKRLQLVQLCATWIDIGKRCKSKNSISLRKISKCVPWILNNTTANALNIEALHILYASMPTQGNWNVFDASNSHINERAQNNNKKTNTDNKNRNRNSTDGKYLIISSDLICYTISLSFILPELVIEWKCECVLELCMKSGRA